MSKKDLFGDEVQDHSKVDFETMLNQSMNIGRRLKVGESFMGEILSIGREQAFVATGTPTDGVLPSAELLDDEKKVAFKVGDVINVRVVRMREGEIFLHRQDSKNAVEGMDNLEDAYDMELPIEGKVLEVVKGGYRVAIGNTKAFCPLSQMDLRAGAESASHIGQKYQFIITKMESRNVVVSRRQFLEQQKVESEGQFLEKSKPGDIFQGVITKIERFGAFVKLETGLEGLIPISELAWGRVQNPSEIVSVGQKVSVSLLKAEELDGRLRMSFSLKQAGGESDPWTQVTQKFPVGTVVTGTVDKKENYGLFVTLAPGVSGLLTKSKWRDHAEGSHYENNKKGDAVQVMVSEIQFEEKRLTLSPPSDVDSGEWKNHQTAPTGFGTFGDLLKGASTKTKK